MYCFRWFPPLFYDPTHLISAYKQFIKLKKNCLLDSSKQFVWVVLVLILKKALTNAVLFS